jgi:exopolyphosphatase / guanosine-5'-triphosphate,3'-diphosphate pyrophosphatase
MARFATIDVGSSSVLIHVAERLDGGAFTPLADQAELTQLGEGLAATGVLCQQAMARTVHTLAGFVALSRELGVVATAAVGTMALRSARNAPAFVARVQRELGLRIQVLSGEEEARLAFLAASSQLPRSGEPVVVFDVGGGSTEFIHGRGAHIERRESLDLGALQLTAAFLSSDPSSPAELAVLSRHLDEALSGLEPYPASRLIASGGTACNLAAHHLGLEVYDPERVHGTVLSRGTLEAMLTSLCSRTIAERRALPGIQHRRAGTILAGATLIVAVQRKLRAQALTVSDRGLRHSLMHERFGAS